METRPQPPPGESAALPSPAGAGAGEAAPWLPRWAREFSDQFFAGTTCVFLLHGNVHDLTRQERDGSAPTAASPSSWRRSSSASGTSSSSTT